MRLTRTVLWMATAWMAAISALHVWLNLDVVRAFAPEPAFKVGFLPVT
ncbi:MAG: hypothetical protein ABIP94_13880 [Planctomycetota bacterium]